MFEKLFDYAGLFPPAGLSMDTAVNNFNSYQDGPNCDLLNSFVVPAARLQEFAAASAKWPSGSWRLSVLSSNWATDQKLIQLFQDSQENADIVSIETRAIEDASEILKSFDNVYVELPLDSGLDQSLGQLKSIGASAKIRMGGLTAEDFPSCDAAAEFFVACKKHEVNFKATAGLHHPIRSRRPTCGEPNAPTADMHGFINVLVAVKSALLGKSCSDVAAVLQQEEVGALESGLSASGTTLADPRSLFHSIGSCSFVEPIDDLKKLGWL